MSAAAKPPKSAPTELELERAWLDDLDRYWAEELTAEEAEELAEPCHTAPESGTIADDEKP